MILTIVFFALSTLTVWHSAFHARLYLAARRQAGTRRAAAPATWPRVTVQLPLYNERYVADRLLAHVAALDYPRDRLQLQVLDDSTDETVALVAERCRELAARGFDIAHVRRRDRVGFKAGALAHGMATATGEFVLVLDADFMPRPGLLRDLLPDFADPRVAVVQARWTHANLEHSWLTRIQGFFIDFHFEVEQVGRGRLGCFTNFNGTAGVWRVAAITDAGGWCADTLTEDLDLSYRAQLRGWRIVVRPEVEVPAELPADIRAFRGQQHRWMKGVAQNARRLVPRILGARIPVTVKAHACAHLLESTTFAALLLLTIATPLAAHEIAHGRLSPWVVLNPLWLASIAMAPAYFAPRRTGEGWLRALGRWVAFLALSFGLALHNTAAVVAGLVGKRSEFVRTPKAGDGPRIARGAYRVGRTDGMLLAETLLLAYLVVGIVAAARSGTLYVMWFPLLTAGGLAVMLGAEVQLRLRALRWRGLAAEAEEAS